MSDPNGLTWAATLVSLAVAISAAGHAVIYKRDPRSATLWVLLIALLPLGGSLLYLLFGINRYQRQPHRPARLHAAHLRNHRKLLVIDGKTGFTGGMNIFSPYWRPDAPEQACHDLHFRLRGPVVAHLMRCFADDWCDTTGERLNEGFWGEPPATADEQGTSWARGIEAGPDEALDRLR